MPKAKPTELESTTAAPEAKPIRFLSWPSSFGEIRNGLPPSEVPSPWSEDLQAQTREAFEELRMAPDGRLHMKHKARGYATIDMLEFQRNGRPLCMARDGRRWEYSDVEALLTDGWAID